MLPAPVNGVCTVATATQRAWAQPALPRQVQGRTQSSRRRVPGARHSCEGAVLSSLFPYMNGASSVVSLVADDVAQSVLGSIDGGVHGVWRAVDAHHNVRLLVEELCGY